MDTKTKQGQATTSHKILTIIAAVLCVVFGLMLICNVIIIVKGLVEPDRPPKIFGVTPLVVLSGSMSGDAEDHIEIGDLIFVTDVDADALEVDNVITFLQGSTVVTHRIIEISEGEDGKRSFVTKGDANNIEDTEQVSEDALIGIYRGRIPMVGDVAMFMQSPLGMILFIGVPLVAFIAYDMIRRQRHSAQDKQKASELEAELARLRALAAEKEDKAE